MRSNRSGVSTTIFAATTTILIIVAAAGYGLYFTQINKPVAKARLGVVGGILNGKIVAFDFYENFSCTPTPSALFANTPFNTTANAATSVTSCEVGAPGTFPANALPVWGMVPAFGALSIFGLTAMGASTDGYPTWNGSVVLTDCTGMGSARTCIDHPPLFYSPVIVMVEQFLGITDSTKTPMNLPVGVLPFPAHTHLVESDAAQADIPWNAIGVFVFDPNIFPNPVTGKCTQVAQSNLTNPTGNCLTSTSQLRAAMATANSGIAQTNQNNPMWEALGKPLWQVIIAGASSPADYNKANSNIDVPFAVMDTDPFPPYSG